MKRVAVGVLAAMLCAAPAFAAPCAPKSLIHIVVTDVDPGIPPTAFGAQPRSYYRLGSGKARIEEAVDAANKLQELIVISSPNMWMVNLYDRTGRHIVDQHPPSIAVLAVFPFLQKFPKLVALELGCEAEYIAANAPMPVRSEQVGSQHFDVYRIEEGNSAIEILELPSTGIPAYARLYQGGKVVLTFHYDTYAVDLPDDPTLFTQPPNITYTEVGDGT